jgi:hypothetical protein
MQNRSTSLAGYIKFLLISALGNLIAWLVLSPHMPGLRSGTLDLLLLMLVSILLGALMTKLISEFFN